MKKSKIVCLFGIGTFSLLSAQEPATIKEEVHELSPFVVETSSDNGYMATDTLAGTRLSTKLNEVGAAVSVYTEEFLKDIEATKLEEILTHTLSTEAAGVRGNYSGLNGGANDAEVRVNPSGVNRVRSLASATRTRDYIPTFIPGDSYNFTTVTINRGPNAILAGTGAAGGVIDAAMRKANFNDVTRLTFKIAEYGGHRQEIHWNKAVIDDVLAIRLDAMNDHIRFRQKQAVRDDQRIYMAGTWNIRRNQRNSFFGNTTLRANIEAGSIDGTPPTGLPPLISLDGWFEDGPYNVNQPERFFPKWYHNGYDKSYYQSDGTFIGRTSAPRVNTGGLPIPAGFPLYEQWVFVFADTTSGDATVGITDPSASMLQGFQGTTRGGKGGFLGTGDLNAWQSQYGRSRLNNRKVFDYYNNLLTGNLDSMEHSFEAYDARLEQLFMGGKAGLELTYNKQVDRRYRDLPISPAGDYIYIDVNKTLSIANETFPEGIPNPNYGRPLISTRDIFAENKQYREAEAYQATAFIKHDFTDSESSLLRLFGRHTLTGLLFDREHQTQLHAFRGTYSIDDQYLSLIQSTGATPGQWSSTANAFWYLADSVENLTSIDQMRLNVISGQRPDRDQEYYLGVWNKTTKEYNYGYTKPVMVLSNINDQIENVRSKAIALNSNWFNDHIITLVGWRDDESKTVTARLPDLEPEGGYDPAKVTYIPSAAQGKETWTKSVVAVFPESVLGNLPFGADFRVYWNESGNFEPVGQRRNFLNQEIGSPDAETEEYGFMLSLFNGKLDVRVNWFETRISGQTISVPNPSGFTFAMINRMESAHRAGLLNFADIEDYHQTEGELVHFDTFEDVTRALFETIPIQLRENMGPDKNFNPRFEGMGSTFEFVDERVIAPVSVSDTVAEGTEIELIWNPSRNWRLALNISKNEAVQADIGALELQYIEDWIENLNTMYDGELLGFHRNPGFNDRDWLEQYTGDPVVRVKNAAAASGTSNPEVRKWRVNGVGRYKFTDGALKGLALGSSFQWQDEKAIGYPWTWIAGVGQVADLNNPYYGPDELIVNFNIGYSRKITLFGQKTDWNINFVLRNAFADDELIPVQALPYPDAEGGIKVNRAIIPRDRTWLITTSFVF